MPGGAAVELSKRSSTECNGEITTIGETRLVWLVRIASSLPTRTVRECHAWKLLSLACRGRLLVLHEGVCLMTAHTRLAFHEWIRLQLCHLIGVTGVACA